jgi:hypothetical protein
LHKLVFNWRFGLSLLAIKAGQKLCALDVERRVGFAVAVQILAYFFELAVNLLNQKYQELCCVSFAVHWEVRRLFG